MVLMSLYEKIISRKECISVIGLGYVGLPIAVEFSKKVKVIGFDINAEKIDNYKRGIDATNEVGNDSLLSCSIDFTSNDGELKRAKFHIVAVPTPINTDKTPNLACIKSACEILGKNLEKGSIVVFESTVYPGVTEDICINLLEHYSGLICGEDFKIGYSPERINPGDREHSITKNMKVVSGIDEEALDEIAKVYGIIVDAGIYKAKSIKIAEAAKVIENAQRDINIAFMNELAIIFNKMGIDTREVIEAASTKWNFLKFTPGLVGGHCIGVDPYYLTYKAEQMGYIPQVILSGRRINDSIGKFIGENTVKLMVRADKSIKSSNVMILGFSFKENIPDCRNTKVIDIVSELCEYGINVHVADYIVDKNEAKALYGINIRNFDEIENVDAIIIAVPHERYKNLELTNLKRKYKNSPCLLIDVKGNYSIEELEKNDYLYWRL